MPTPPSTVKVVNNKAQFDAAVNNTAIKTIKLGDSFAGNVTVDRVVNLDLGGKTLTGNLTFDTIQSGTIILSNGIVTGSLTIDTKNASFVNDGATVRGTTTIVNVAPGTFTNKGTLGAVKITDTDGTRFVNNGTTGVIDLNTSGAVKLEGSFVNEVKVTKAASVTVPAGTTVSKLTVTAPNAVVTNNGTVTELKADAAVEVKGDAPEAVTGTPGNVSGATSVGTQAALEAALANNKVTSIVLTDNIETTKQLLVTTAGQKIDGNGKTISAVTGMTYSNPNKSILTVLNANNVVISNLAVDASKVNTPDHWGGVYGAQVYTSTGVKLDDVTLMNADAGLLVNGSDVTANNIKTSNNEFGGIEVSQGSDVSSPSKLTVTGLSTHSENVHIWTVGQNASVVSDAYKSAKDGRTGKEDFVNFILKTENREVPFKLLEAPTDGLAELTIDGLVADDVRYLAFNLQQGNAQKVATLDEVKNFISTQYNGAILNIANIKVDAGKISIDGSLLSRADWNKVKANGDKTIPYKITVLNKDKTAKIAKIAMYQDGKAVIESLLPAQ